MSDLSRTTGLPAYPGPEPADAYGVPAQPPPRRAHPVDVTVTILELVLGTVGAALSSFSSLFLLMAGDACTTPRSCPHSGLIGLGVAVGFLSPWVLMAVAIAVSAVLMLRKRLAFWVPLVAVLACVGMLALALFLVAAGSGS